MGTFGGLEGVLANNTVHKVERAALIISIKSICYFEGRKLRTKGSGVRIAPGAPYSDVKSIA